MICVKRLQKQVFLNFSHMGPQQICTAAGQKPALHTAQHPSACSTPQRLSTNTPPTQSSIQVEVARKKRRENSTSTDARSFISRCTDTHDSGSQSFTKMQDNFIFKRCMNERKMCEWMLFWMPHWKNNVQHSQSFSRHKVQRTPRVDENWSRRVRILRLCAEETIAALTHNHF